MKEETLKLAAVVLCLVIVLVALSMGINAKVSIANWLTIEPRPFDSAGGLTPTHADETLAVTPALSRSEQPTPAALSAPTLPPSTAKALPQTEPPQVSPALSVSLPDDAGQTVRTYYEYLNRGLADATWFAQAWNILTPEFQRSQYKGGLAAYTAQKKSENRRYTIRSAVQDKVSTCARLEALAGGRESTTPLEQYEHTTVQVVFSTGESYVYCLVRPRGGTSWKIHIVGYPNS